MAHQLVIKGLAYKPRFLRDLKGLQPQLLASAKAAVSGLQKNPIPTSLRLHCVDKSADPKIFTIDVISNHSYKISFHMEGDIAVMRRVASHKDIDRLP